MRPYLSLQALQGRHSTLLLCSLVAVCVTCAAEAQKTSAPQPESAKPVYATAKNDALTRSGAQHYYDLDYDQAIRDFEQALAAHPDDPFAANHLLAAVFFKELYKAGALDSSAYSNNSFLARKQIRIDEKTDAQIKELIKNALEFADKKIAADPRDPSAFYARGVTRGIQSTYTALVDKSWFAALGSAKGARKDHERALEIAPDYSDAKLIVGMHSYIVGCLPWAVRVLAHVVGESGNKSQGIKELFAAANGDGDASLDAKSVLSLFLRREQRYDDALKVQKELAIAHPRNFLFALEEANILKDAGKGPESIAAYRKILGHARQGEYYDPHLEFLYFGLGEALRGQRDFSGASSAYDEVHKLPHADADMRLRCELAAGEMYDLLQKRELATKKYEAVIAANSGSDQADAARKYLKEPYRQD